RRLDLRLGARVHHHEKSHRRSPVGGWSRSASVHPTNEAGRNRHRGRIFRRFPPSPRNDARVARMILVIDPRERDLGDGFTVSRLLPSGQRRAVGPFLFFDHFGPTALAPGGGLDVRPHPHVNLATVTYLFEGEIFHRDSLGSACAIRPGDINWMT